MEHWQLNRVRDSGVKPAGEQSKPESGQSQTAYSSNKPRQHSPQSAPRGLAANSPHRRSEQCPIVSPTDKPARLTDHGNKAAGTPK